MFCSSRKQTILRSFISLREISLLLPVEKGAASPPHALLRKPCVYSRSSAGPYCEPSHQPGSWARLSICKARAASHLLHSKQGKGRYASYQKGSEFAESIPVGNVKIHFQWSSSHCNSSSDAARVLRELCQCSQSSDVLRMINLTVSGTASQLEFKSWKSS